MTFLYRQRADFGTEPHFNFFPGMIDAKYHRIPKEEEDILLDLLLG